MSKNESVLNEGRPPQPPPGSVRQASRNVWEYQPQAVVEHDGALGVYSGERLRTLMAAETPPPILFYDLFRSLDGTAVVGVQANEFAAHFGRVRFSHQGRPLKSRCVNAGGRTVLTDPDERVRGIAMWSVRLPRGAAGVPMRIAVGIGSGAEVEVEVPPNPFADWARTEMYQQTIQKDDPLTMIRDHCLFHHRAHGFERMVLYDNGSADYAGLLEGLAVLDAGLRMVVINWPFPMHRPFMMRRMGRKHEVFAQVAAFNHGLRMLGGLSRYGVNLDMDEYLYNASGMPLGKLMARHTRLLPACLIADYKMPNVVEGERGGPARAYDFKYKPRYSGDCKYFYRIGRTPLGMEVAHLNVHDVTAQRNLVFSMLRGRAWLAGRRVAQHYGNAPPELIRIYHYKAMGSRWQLEKRPEYVDAGRWAEVKPDPQKHERAEDMLRLLEEVGLAEPPGKGREVLG